MSSFVNIPTVGGELHGLKYEPNRKGRLGSALPPQVSFFLGATRVVLDIADAHDLSEALPNVLAQHDYAEYLSDESRSVA